MIEIITFTGVDAGVPLTPKGKLADIARRYPQAEFGILVGSQTGMNADHGIFPSLAFINSFKQYCRRKNIRAAVHLCGAFARRVMGDGGPPDLIYRLCQGFDRVQLNLHGDSFNSARVNVKVAAIMKFAEKVECDRVILQHRAAWDTVPVQHPAVEYLFDLSEGSGIESFYQWPKPAPHLGRLGYAGGIGPYSIGRAVTFADQHPEARLWFDMESQIRLGGHFNLAAVLSVCEQVWRRPRPWVAESL